MNTLSSFWRSLSFSTRLTASFVGLMLFGNIVLTSLLYKQYEQAQVDATLNKLQAQSENNATAFTDWLTARQDEIRYLASTSAAQQLDLAQLDAMMLSLSELHRYYDSIYIVSPEGIGMAGVTQEGNRVVRLDETQARTFNVADRDWFREAVTGKPSFSQPVISRATGNRVSTIAIPIMNNNRVIAVARGAVKIDTLIEKIAALPRANGTEIYLLDSDKGLAITPASSIKNLNEPLNTKASESSIKKTDYLGVYPNASGYKVMGSVNFIPLLGWGLAVEQDEVVALADVKQTLFIIVGIASITLLISGFICLLLIHGVIKLLGGDPAYAASIVHKVADGNLNTPIQLRANDRDSLLAAIAMMQDKLREIIRHISSYSEQVAAASTELASINEQTAHTLEQQSQEITNSAAALNEMSSALEEVARNTQHTAGASSSARDAAKLGHQAVSTTIDAIHRLATEVEEATTVIHHLKNDSDKIDSVMEVIKSIAEQTNLLALNAAIEAARAGETGRGFAVVADEVRGLASRTKESTSEIQTMIEKLQTGSIQAVNAMQVSEQGTKASVELANNTGASLRQIMDAVALIDNTAQQIASATEEQTMVSREINESIHNISSSVEMTSEHVKQSFIASEQLAALANQLQGLVAQFKV